MRRKRSFLFTGLALSLALVFGMTTVALADNIRIGVASPFTGDLAAYGDTASDISMLGMSQQPVAVCPDDELRKVAVARGWKIIEFAE